MSLQAESRVYKTFDVKHDSFLDMAALDSLVSEKVSWTPYFNKSSTLMAYGYFVKFDGLKLTSSEQNSSPFYKVSISLPDLGKTTTGKIEILQEKETLTYGRQHVRPLTQEEIKQFDSINFKSWLNDSLAIWKIHQKLPGPLTDNEKLFFCLWKKNHDVTAKALQSEQGEFFKNLNCQ